MKNNRNNTRNNVLAFRYKSFMPSAAYAIERQINNMIVTFGRETVLATLKQSHGLGEIKAKRKLAKVG